MKEALILISLLVLAVAVSADTLPEPETNFLLILIPVLALIAIAVILFLKATCEFWYWLIGKALEKMDFPIFLGIEIGFRLMLMLSGLIGMVFSFLRWVGAVGLILVFLLVMIMFLLLF